MNNCVTKVVEEKMFNKMWNLIDKQNIPAFKSCKLMHSDYRENLLNFIFQWKFYKKIPILLSCDILR